MMKPGDTRGKIPYMRTNVRVGALIVRDEKLLLIHRRKRGDEYWVLVGGGAEEGETWEQALAREVEEETSFKLNKYNLVLEGDDGRSHQVLYECEVGPGEPMLGGPERDANNENNWFNPEWVDVNQVGELKSLYPNIIRQWLAERKKA